MREIYAHRKFYDLIDHGVMHTYRQRT